MLLLCPHCNQLCFEDFNPPQRIRQDLVLLVTIFLLCHAILLFASLPTNQRSLL